MSDSQYQPYAVIVVTEPVLQKGPNNEKIPSYVTYLVSGKDPHGVFNIRRRFREFLVLRNKFVQRFIGMYIPPIPSKRASGNTEERYVQQRRKFLNYFCLKIADRPYLFDSDIFQTFLRGDPDFQRAARFISGQEYALLANIYDIQYKAASEAANMPKILIQIQKQAQNLRVIEKKLTVMRNQIQQIANIKTQFVNQYCKCKNTILPRFEQEILSKHGLQSESMFYFQNQHFQQKLKQYTHFCQGNLLLDYVEAITYDIRQSRALLEAIQSRRIFQDKKANFQIVRRQSKEQLEKLKNGQMSLKSIFTSGNREAQIKQLQSYIPQYERNEGFLGACLPYSAIGIYRDIQRFKKGRSIDYLGTLQIIAQKQMRLLNTYGQMLFASEKKDIKLKQQSQAQKSQT